MVLGVSKIYSSFNLVLVIQVKIYPFTLLYWILCHFQIDIGKLGPLIQFNEKQNHTNKPKITVVSSKVCLIVLCLNCGFISLYQAVTQMWCTEKSNCLHDDEIISVLLLNWFLLESLNNKNKINICHTIDYIHTAHPLFSNLPTRGKTTSQSSAASVDWRIDKPRCQSCLQVTLFAGNKT